ncbi:MAG: S-methyl-5-thioribose-1-phosphate isomerase [Candidatus Omnitrophica bacterium]|nr:S-methyl-5-thioribose-1-phosphate isomerase [Candidatus Omnitrophota bacterium]MCM8802623.1 S-methyl-5-thioribose-1-phosphate isomerase [Candidatus Omnitrophota bacterium]
MKKIPVKPFWWRNKIYIIDQRLLPKKEVILKLESAKDVYNAIKEMKIRGAPLIGCIAAYGVVVSFLENKKFSNERLKDKINQDINFLRTSRPTAYNLFYALKRMEKIVSDWDKKNKEKLFKKLLKEAESIYKEDLSACYKIGIYGNKLIKNNMSILTHCNAGGLATTGFGTALAPIYIAKQKGKNIHVYVDETRPVLQGARLTAWELEKNRIPYTIISDNMAGYLMSKKKIDIVIVGADRIAKNGDTANKIGTYSLAVLASFHKIPFYVAAPISTFDFNIENGAEIPIEERNEDEIKKINGEYICPKDARVFNPAFDVTPNYLITGFITEKGILKHNEIKNLGG